MKPVQFNNTVLRDGHQSLAATRMSTAQMLPAAPILDEMGFFGLETWGGATIDACLRFLGENPFDRMRALKQAAPRTPHIMLLRGQNIVQYTSFPDDVVEAFVACSAAAGVDVFRVFDAANDIRNVETAIRAVIKQGKHARGEICYTTSPAHTLAGFTEFGVRLAKLGCDSIGIKDMAGILAPRPAYELVKNLKKRTGLPVIVHCHDTAGLAGASYYAAIEAGADVVETSIVPFANGTSQPDTDRMLALLEDHPRKPEFDREKLRWLRSHFEKVYAELSEFTSTNNERTDADVVAFQVPGGMISNFRNQLRDLKLSDRLEDVLREIPYVRQCLGWIPLVTPTSQIVGTQAVFNVKFGRWKNFAPAAMDIALGKFGKTPGPVDPEVQKLAVEKTGQQPVTHRMADDLLPRMDSLRSELAEKGYPPTDELAVLHAMFPLQVQDLLQGKKPQQKAPEPARPATPAPVPVPAVAAPSTVVPFPATTTAGRSSQYRITVEGVTRDVVVQEM